MADEFDIPDFSKQTPQTPASDATWKAESEKQIQQIFAIAAWSVLLGVLVAPLGAIFAGIALTKVSAIENKLRVLKLSALQKKLLEAKTCAYCGLIIGIGVMVFFVSFRLQFFYLPKH